MQTHRINQIVMLLSLATLVCGCAGGPALPPPGTSAIAAGASVTDSSDGLTVIDPLGDAAARGMTGSTLVPGNLSTIYARLARGLNRCWLREGQGLGRAYVLHANIAPAPADRGTLTIHNRSPSGRRGLKAFRVDLVSASGQTRVTSTNLKLLASRSRPLSKDIERWAVGSTECSANVGFVPPPKRTPGRPRSLRKAF